MQSKLFKLLNTFALFLIIYFCYFHVFNFYNKLDYKLIFVDERQLIDSVLNIFQFVDEFGRFDEISSPIIKKVFIVASELVIGGNLDFGRLYTNFFVIFAGPFYLISFENLLIFSRFIQAILFYFSLFIISKLFLTNKYFYLFPLICLSLPQSFYIIQNPKPDSMMILFFFIGLFLLNKKKNNLGFFLIGASVGIKIISIIPTFLLILYLIFVKKDYRNKLELLKSSLIVLTGIFIAQPAFLIPNTSIYKRIFGSLLSASKYNQNSIIKFSTEYFSNWISELVNYFNFSKILFYIFLIIVVVEIISNLLKKNLLFENYLLLSFFCLFILITFFVSRVWLYYLVFPFIFFVLYIFLTIKKNAYSTNLLKISLVWFSIFGLVNFSNNLSTYVEVNNAWDDSFNEAINFIEKEYQNNEGRENIVLWDPDFYFPRIDIHYEGDFLVLENWDFSNELSSLVNSEVGFIVTRKNLKLNNNLTVKKFGELNVYFNENY